MDNRARGTDANADVGALIERLTALSLHLSAAELQRLAAELNRLIEAECHKADTREDDLERISTRETEVLTLLANGYSRRDIADALGVTLNTAASHVLNIYRKLDINSIAEATQFALRSGLLR